MPLGKNCTRNKKSFLNNNAFLWAKAQVPRGEGHLPQGTMNFSYGKAQVPLENIFFEFFCI
jgi:hypothetical protein